MEKKEPAAMSKLLPYSQATKDLNIQEKVAQFFMPAAFINDSESEILALEALVKEQAIGGVCFFHSRASAATNYEGTKKVIFNEKSLDVLKARIRRLQDAAKYPLLIAIDAEWGLAMRIENTPQYPYAITLGAIAAGEDLIYQTGRQIALDCKDAGIHWNFAPVADINNNPDNPVIGYRSFGEDKDSVAKKAWAFASGMQSAGVLNSVKHFPGHGDTATDSHLNLPLISKDKEALISNELFPFSHLIKNGIDSVMVGHLSVPALTGEQDLPTSISSGVIKQLLRKELGFKGIVVTDALNMYAVSKRFPKKGWLEWLAFQAGNDVLCFAEHPLEGISTIVANASHDMIEMSFKRVWNLKEKAFANAAMSSPKKTYSPSDLNTKLAEASLSIVKGQEIDIESFKKVPFETVGLTSKKTLPFFDHIGGEIELYPYFSSQSPLQDITKKIVGLENVLIALVPPKVKPLNNFDISIEEIQFINDLAKNKKVVLYLFGNPYVLNLLDVESISAVVVVYQDFVEFQENAAKHFLGKTMANGKLPVTLKPYRK